jgi:hypothetical protein
MAVRKKWATCSEEEEGAVTAWKWRRKPRPRGRRGGDYGSVRTATSGGVWAAAAGSVALCRGLGDRKKRKSQFIPMRRGKAPY